MNLRQAGDFANKISEIQWVKWIHPNTQPANTNEEKKSNIAKAKTDRSHCAICLNMNGCCFTEDKCPPSPLHPNCHCKAERIDGVAVTVECPIDKFTGYIFSDKHIGNGKKQMFEKWGFTITDSTTLKAELENQAYIAYISGNYALDLMDEFGQRINIEIKLTNPNGNQVHFTSGWLVYPNGTIKNATPYGDD